MKLKITISLLLMSLIVINSVYSKSDIEYFPQDKPPSILELAFLRELGPSIVETMFSNGNTQLFMDGRIEKLKKIKKMIIMTFR